MKRTLNFLGLLALLFSFSSCNDDEVRDTVSLNEIDRAFMTSASYSNQAEIEFAGLALLQSDNDSVMMFAQMMLTDHSMSKAQLDSLADAFNYPVPDTLDLMHKMLRTQLMGMSGVTFDTAYINGQIRDHNAAISVYTQAVNSGNNQQVKNHASAKLPHLQMHLDLAEEVAATLP